MVKNEKIVVHVPQKVQIDQALIPCLSKDNNCPNNAANVQTPMPIVEKHMPFDEYRWNTSASVLIKIRFHIWEISEHRPELIPIESSGYHPILDNSNNIMI